MDGLFLSRCFFGWFCFGGDGFFWNGGGDADDLVFDDVGRGLGGVVGLGRRVGGFGLRGFGGSGPGLVGEFEGETALNHFHFDDVVVGRAFQVHAVEGAVGFFFVKDVAGPFIETQQFKRIGVALVAAVVNAAGEGQHGKAGGLI